MKRCKILYDLLKINFTCLVSWSFPVIHSLNHPFSSYTCHSFICSSTRSLIPLAYLPSLPPSLPASICSHLPSVVYTMDRTRSNVNDSRSHPVAPGTGSLSLCPRWLPTHIIPRQVLLITPAVTQPLPCPHDSHPGFSQGMNRTPQK